MQKAAESVAAKDVENSSPNLSYLSSNFPEAIKSFYATVEKIIADNPVDMSSFMTLLAKLKSGIPLDGDESTKFASLKLDAQKQGKAVGAVMGFFLKFKPYPMLAEIRAKEAVFQPVFGPVLVVEGDAVRDVLERHHEFTVDPYGAEMRKSMTDEYNGGFDTFILSTDDDKKYIEDKSLLTSVVRREDAELITDLIHKECMNRVQESISKARSSGELELDVVTTLARFVPVVLGHHYLGVPSEAKKGSFELSDDMLKYYGDKVAGPDGITPLPIEYQRADGTKIVLPDSALKRGDGVIPDELTIYNWIVAAFKHFFNNVTKDIEVQAHGVRAYRELLVYLLREVDIQRSQLESKPDSVPDNMLTRLLRIQMGLDSSNENIDPVRVSDLRIAENVMGTMVGAVAGQEEATCRAIDSMISLSDGEFTDPSKSDLSGEQRVGTFDEAVTLAQNVLNQNDVEASRSELNRYVSEALRLKPQGEVLLRLCVSEGAVISNSRPLSKGTLVFAAHGSAMQDVASAESFILGRDSTAYLHFGFKRHKCLGQYVSPVLMRESLIALLALEGVRRIDAKPGELSFPRERRSGRFQLDDDNLYAQSFVLTFDDSGSTKRFYN